MGTWEGLVNNVALPNEANYLHERANHIISHVKAARPFDCLVGLMARASKYVNRSFS